MNDQLGCRMTLWWWEKTPLPERPNGYFTNGYCNEPSIGTVADLQYCEKHLSQAPPSNLPRIFIAK